MNKTNSKEGLRRAGRLGAAVLVFLLLSASGGSGAQEAFLSLEDAVSEAIRNNALIEEAIEKQRAAIEDRKSATADLLPKLSAEYSYSYIKEEPYVRYDVPGVGATEFPLWGDDRFSWNVSATQPLFTGFALTTRRRISELGVRIAQIEKEQAVMDVTRNTKVSYFNILLAESYVEVADETVRQLEAHVEDARRFYDQELIPKNDLLKSQVALANARQKQVDAGSRLDVAVAALNTILRRDITEKTRVMKVDLKRSAGLELSDLVTYAMSHRPELKHLDAALIQADLGILMAQSNFYPKLYLTGRYEQLGDNPRATNNEFGNAYNTIIGAQAVWPFFEWGKTRAEVNKARYDKKALDAKVEGIRDSIRLEVKNAFEQLLVADKNIGTAQEALDQAEENFRITNLQYQQQVTTSTEVLDARAFLTQAEMNYYSALYGYMIARADLERAVGVKDHELETR